MEGAVILLAAGNSERMGKPKQLLPYRGKTLLWQTARTALDAKIGRVMVVTGAADIDLQTALQDLELEWVHNEHWASGMATSIQAGLRKLLQTAPIPEAVLILVADQPYVTVALLQQLWERWKTSEQPMAACVYNKEPGTPALFSKDRFADLLELKGKKGAKKLLLAKPEEVATIAFPEGAIDIDTPADYEQLKNENEQGANR